MSLTELQDRLLSWIEDYYDRYGYPPARREMQAAMGYNTLSSIQQLLFALREQGYVDWEESKSRSVRSLRPKATRIPIVGVIAAHSLVETFTDQETEFIDLSNSRNTPSVYTVGMDSEAIERFDAAKIANKLVV